MSYALAQKAIEEHFAVNWTATPISFGNVKFDPPANTPWVRVGVALGSEEQISMGPSGSRTFRTAGVLVVQIFTPLWGGERQALQLADSVANLWRATQLSGTQFRAPSVDRIGDEGNGWWQVNVTVPFYRDALF